MYDKNAKKHLGEQAKAGDPFRLGFGSQPMRRAVRLGTQSPVRSLTAMTSSWNRSPVGRKPSLR